MNILKQDPNITSGSVVVYVLRMGKWSDLLLTASASLISLAESSQIRLQDSKNQLWCCIPCCLNALC